MVRIVEHFLMNMKIYNIWGYIGFPFFFILILTTDTICMSQLFG